jgi:hypothetical protein
LPGDNSDKLMNIFHAECKKHGIVDSDDEIFKYLHTFEEKKHIEQISLF